jgi:L-amino acid N-acyltransferase YncA
MTHLTLTRREEILARAAAQLAGTVEGPDDGSLNIRPATREDFPEMLALFRKALAAGDTYALEADTPVREAYQYWFGPGIDSWVAEADGRVVGMHRLIANQKGRGSHVANVSILVDPDARRQGVGLALGRHFLAEARRAGFLAVQANLVVSTNKPMLALAEKLGFTRVGTLPRAFRHRRFGLVDAHVLYRAL